MDRCFDEEAHRYRTNALASLDRKPLTASGLGLRNCARNLLRLLLFVELGDQGSLCGVSLGLEQGFVSIDIRLHDFVHCRLHARPNRAGS